MSTGNQGPGRSDGDALKPASLDDTDINDTELESVAGGAVGCQVMSNAGGGITDLPKSPAP